MTGFVMFEVAGPFRWRPKIERAGPMWRFIWLWFSVARIRGIKFTDWGSYLAQTRNRLQYAGAIGLLCQCSTQVDDETRELILQAVEDWCAQSGWSVKQVGHRIEVVPPDTVGRE